MRGISVSVNSVRTGVRYNDGVLGSDTETLRVLSGRSCKPLRYRRRQVGSKLDAVHDGARIDVHLAGARIQGVSPVGAGCPGLAA